MSVPRSIPFLAGPFLLTGHILASDRLLPPTVSMAGDQPVALASGDLNGDGYVDVVRAERDAPQLHVFLGDSGGNLGPGTTWPGPFDTRNVVVSDADRDGDLDIIAVGATGPSEILVRLNDGTGDFGAVRSSAPIHDADDFAIGDLDGDGDPDISACDYHGKRLHLYFNDGAGVFVAGDELRLPAHTHRVAIADVDQDTLPDVIAICEEGSTNAYLFINEGAGSFAPRVAIATGVSNHTHLVLDDWTGDGHLDLAIGSQDGISILHGLGNGQFWIAHALSRPNWNATLASVDFDGDTRPDLVLHFVQPVSQSGSLALLAFEPSTGWELEEEHAIGTTGGWGCVHAADLDADGFPEVLAAQRDEMRLFRHSALDCDGNGQFDPEEIEDDAGLDLDSNGVLDVCESVTPYCTTSPNTAGPGARMGAVGPPSFDLNACTLEATGAPPSQPGLFYFGDHAQTPPLPFGNGWKCVGGQTVRLNPPQMVGVDGRAERLLDLALPEYSGFQPGDTAYFQFWYRDNPQVGTTFNLSDAIGLRFLP